MKFGIPDAEIQCINIRQVIRERTEEDRFCPTHSQTLKVIRIIEIEGRIIGHPNPDRVCQSGTFASTVPDCEITLCNLNDGIDITVVLQNITEFRN